MSHQSNIEWFQQEGPMSGYVSILDVGRRSVTIVKVGRQWRVRFTDAPEGQYLAFGPALYGGRLTLHESGYCVDAFPLRERNLGMSEGTALATFFRRWPFTTALVVTLFVAVRFIS